MMRSNFWPALEYHKASTVLYQTLTFAVKTHGGFDPRATCVLGHLLWGWVDAFPSCAGARDGGGCFGGRFIQERPSWSCG